MTSLQCPSCSEPAAAEHTPFCSLRCRAADLHGWLSGAYQDVVPQFGAEDDEGLGGAE